MLLVAGLLGFFMKLYGYSPAATVLALVLGSMAEENLLQSLIISDGSLSIFVDRPISFVLSMIVLMVIAMPMIFRLLRKNIYTRKMS